MTQSVALKGLEPTTPKLIVHAESYRAKLDTSPATNMARRLQLAAAFEHLQLTEVVPLQPLRERKDMLITVISCQR